MLPLVLLHGCTNFYPPSRIKELKPNARYWASYDSSRRSATFVTGADGNVIKSCSEPAPDVALSLSTSLKGTAKTQGVDASLDAAATSTALALAGRDNVVLLAREALFRVCEQSANGTWTQPQVEAMFRTIFESTRAMAVAQAAKAQGDAANTRSKVEAAKALPEADRPKALLEALRAQ